MTSAFSPTHPYFRIRVEGKDDSFAALSDISNFLYDFNLLYKISRLSTDPKYEDFHFSYNVNYRTGRPLEEPDRLCVQSLSERSPLEVVVVLTAVPMRLALL